MSNADRPAVRSRGGTTGELELSAALRREILALPGDRALARIVEHPRTASLVQSFAATDLHLLVHEIGLADALPLLALASNEQLQYLLDAEIWEADRIEGAALTLWLAALLQASAERAVVYLMQHQRDLLEYFMARNLRLLILEDDLDPSFLEDDWFSLDGVFHMRIRPAAEAAENFAGAAEDREDFIRALLRRLSDHDYILWRDLLLEASVLSPAEHEEEMLRWRMVRLAEKGFPPFEEALGVYRPLAPAALANRRVRRPETGDPQTGNWPVPCAADGLLPEAGAFAEALAAYAAGGDLESVEAEFATLCNRLAVADRRTVRRREDLADLARKVAGHLGIGLERMATVDGRFDPARGAALIRRHHLEDLFRVAREAIRALKNEAESWQRRSWYRRRGLRLTFWLEEGLGVVGGLLLKRPLFFDNYRSGVLYREFETLDDLTRTERALKAVVALDALLARMTFSAPLEPAAALDWKKLLLTLWVRDRLGTGDEASSAVELRDLRRFWSDLRSVEGEVRRRRFLLWLADRCALSPEAVSEALAPVLEDLFRELEDEYAAVAPEDLDRRFIRLFLVA